MAASSLCRRWLSFAALGALQGAGALLVPARPAAASRWLRPAVPAAPSSAATTPAPRGSLLLGRAVDAAAPDVTDAQADAGAAAWYAGGMPGGTAAAAGGAAGALDEMGEEEEADEEDDPNAKTVWSKADLVGSEWKIGILWGESTKPQETWIRFKEDFELEWGVNAKGTWDLDGQFLSFSRDFALGWGGKRLFAAKLTQQQNEVYVEGVVRGWSPLVPASVMGQWQAIRLGVDRKPYGIPFWNTPEYAARVAAENAATAAAEAAALDSAAPPEEPEPFWSGLVTSAAQIKNALAPPGTPTGDAISRAMAEAGVEKDADAKQATAAAAALLAAEEAAAFAEAEAAAEAALVAMAEADDAAREADEAADAAAAGTSEAAAEADATALPPADAAAGAAGPADAVANAAAVVEAAAQEVGEAATNEARK